MEEHEYKSTYNQLASVPCVFEKALTNKHAKCCLSKHFCLADREGYSCNDKPSSGVCRDLLELMRKKSLFALKLREAGGPLPHNMDIRVQAGGIQGIYGLLDDNSAETAGESSEDVLVNDISGVVSRAIAKYGSLDRLPYSEIMQSIVQFQVKRRRQR